MKRASFFALLAFTLHAQSQSLVLSGAGDPIAPRAAIERFVALAGGPDAEIVYIPTAASGIRTPSGLVVELPENGEIVPKDAPLANDLASFFGVKRVTILHTRSREVADSKAFVEPLTKAKAVWIGYGNAGRLMQTIGGTRTMRELQRIVARGGVIGGNSAGAIVQGSFILRGRPDKPVLMANGYTTGLGLLKNVAINPHLTSAKRELELVNVLDANPLLLGIGIEDNAAIIVHGDELEVVGEGRVAIYDNERHGADWYYWLQPGDRFDLRHRRVLPRPR
ncbi:MAG: cyanophycinase [Acidobacteria bacterium]|nr:cyanophycinase [Acidobacteriota bacterium]